MRNKKEKLQTESSKKTKKPNLEMAARMNLALAGAFVGISATILVALGNPKNMGFCIACFLRDIAGAMKFHSASAVQYFRPEIIGLVLGSFAISVAKGEFRARAGSSPFLRFCIGFCVMLGALLFLGCPLRMVLRLAAGDANAAVGFFGFAAGIAVACAFLNNGFSLGRSQPQCKLEGGAISLLNVIFLILIVAAPKIFAFSENGPGSMHAPIFISAIFGFLAGIAAQRARLCLAGGIRDLILLRDSTLLIGFAAIFVSALAINLATGNFNFGFSSQPIAHSSQLWNFFGMFVVGLGSAMLGGCPLRQLILAGEGDGDAAVGVTGMFFGAAFAHNFSLVGNAAENGPNLHGKIACCAAVIFLLAVAAIRSKKTAASN